MSHASNMLAAIEAILEGKATDDVMSYSIAGRALTKYSISELMQWRKTYAAEVRDEELAAAGKKKPKRVVNWFGR